MKHLIENNQIVRSEGTIPSIFEKDGSTILGYNLLPEADLFADGWRDEVRPEYDPIMQQLIAPYYSEFHNAVIYDVVDRIGLPTLAEAKAQKLQQIKASANQLLSTTDWYIIRKIEKAKNLPADISAERDLIRNRSNDMETAVLSLQTLRDVLTFEVKY